MAERIEADCCPCISQSTFRKGEIYFTECRKSLSGHERA